MKGYRTYIVGIIMILYAVVVLGLTNSNWEAAISMVLGALALMGIRIGIKNDILSNKE